MKPALVLPKPVTSLAPAPAVARPFVLDRSDLRNIGLILLGLAILLVLIPPGRSYPVSDDWMYAQSVSRLLDLNYRPHDAAQPSALGQLVWGALFASLFGNNFTVLSLVTILMSALCLVTFYVLLRHLGVEARYAFFGTALLGLNPMYVFLTYTFMTDITFMAYFLAACLFFVRGVQGRGEVWFWLGGVATALAYLTRQHGIVLVPAILAYLWWSRRLSVRNAIACAAVPLATLVVFMVWERGQPQQMVARQIADTMQSILADPGNYLVNQMQRFTWVVTLPGLCLLPFFSITRKPLLGLLFFIFLALFQFRGLPLFGSLFVEFGNIVDHTGLVLYDYNKPVLWSEQMWSVLGIIGSLSFAFFLANCVLAAWDWLRSKPLRERGHNDDPALFFYLTGLLLAGITLVSPFLFDRYLLPIMPAMLLFPLRRWSAQAALGKPKALVVPWLLLLPVALFSVVAMRDYKAETAARWDLAESVAASGVKREEINAGYEWLGWYLFPEGVDYIHASNDYREAPFAAMAMLKQVYLVSEQPKSGYTQVGETTYDAWLLGGQERKILLLKKN